MRIHLKYIRALCGLRLQYFMNGRAAENQPFTFNRMEGTKSKLMSMFACVRSLIDLIYIRILSLQKMPTLRILYIRIFCLALIIAGSHQALWSQSTVPTPLVGVRGMPRIIHYTKKEFNSDPQFWAMCQDLQGVL